jgi:hypothetical protein
MTCRGYDPKAVKIGKSIKRLAANHLDAHKRGEFIRGYVKIAENELRTNKRDNK